MPAVRQVDIRILQQPGVLPVPPRLVDWDVQPLLLPRWRAASSRHQWRRKRAGRARVGAEPPLPPSLPAEDAHGFARVWCWLAGQGFLVAREGAKVCGCGQGSG